MTVSPVVVFVYTVINTVKYDGMSIDFIGTYRKRKTPKSLLRLGVLDFTGLFRIAVWRRE